MKKWMIICMAALLGITGCGGKKEAAEGRTEQTVLETAAKETNARETENKAEEPEGDEFSRHFSEMTVDGKPLSIPATYEELTACGFEIKSVYKDMIYAGEKVSGELTHTAHENSSFPVVFSFKGDGDPRTAEECEVVSFSIDADTMQDAEITFYGGISKESSREEVAALLDEEFADQESAQYKRFLDGKKYTGMDVLFYQDRLLTVQIDNYDGYFKQ